MRFTFKLKINRKMNPSNNRFLSLLLVFMFLFSISVPCFSQDSPPEPTIRSLEQAEALFIAGLYDEALKMLDKLEEEISIPEQQVQLYLLKARSHLGREDMGNGENAVREIFKQGLSDHIQMDSLEEKLRFLFEKVRPEYWFALKKEKADEEKFDRLIIQQYQKKPKKKRLLPKLILGAVLVGVVVVAVLFITSNTKEEEDKGNLGTLKFENGYYQNVNIEIYDIDKTVLGTNNNSYGRPPVNFAYVDLPPGTHTLIVTSTSTYTGETTVFTYSIEIITGQETHFVFFPTS
ncbi:MAG: hypothetical protein KAS65_00015 [Candidatus Aminicenantes bacterium]|nr:hypothetical protein [Candidatus Aminicenantes bacterium]